MDVPTDAPRGRRSCEGSEGWGSGTSPAMDGHRVSYSSTTDHFDDSGEVLLFLDALVRC